jgi:predicted nucleic acid-binding protein
MAAPSTPDPDDDYLVALAQKAGANCLVSGDGDLTGLADSQPPVFTPRAFFDSLED